jgi:hypothetical protein
MAVRWGENAAEAEIVLLSETTEWKREKKQGERREAEKQTLTKVTDV